MKLLSSAIRNSLFAFTFILALPAFRASAQSKPAAASAPAAQAAAIPARITQAIDETQLVRLKGNVHPLARPAFDRGPVSNATPMKRMMLLLQRSPEQQATLRLFMDEQLSNESPNFQSWLTPDQFGKLYGPSDADIQAVTSWLSSHGFTGARVNRGKTLIEFSGNVAQVRSAFHTEIHKFVVNGENRQANTGDPQIPAALTPVVAGIVSLHNFPSHSMRHVVGAFTHSRATGETTPQFTGSGNPPPFFAMGPADFAKIYNIPPALDGTGGKIAIVGFSDIDVTDAHNFRALFGLPVNDPIIVTNGPDPGFNGEEGEADLDVQWSGAVAPKAEIDFVTSEGTLTSDPLILSAEYVVDNNSDDIMSLSFGVCEANLGSEASTIAALWEQAAAQGITVTVSAGDNGTAGCDDFNSQANASGGIAVNGIASTQFNIAVGGTDFDDVGTQSSFWSTANSTDGKKESALGYIHEVPWNDSCAAAATSANLTTCATPDNIVAGSGGPSVLYAKPSFQNGITPNGIAASDNHRYLPDVSLFASDGQSSKSFYVICQADAAANPSTECASTGPFSFFGVGGTSASSPSFAGIMALIGQSEFNAGRSRRQGNANQVLYKIAATPANSCDSSATPLAGSTTCAFYNVTHGNNSVPCAAGSPNCTITTGTTSGVLFTTTGTTQTPAFTAAAGSGSIPSYDLATGLGTVNVANLATAWGTAVGAFKGTTTTLKINGSATPGTIAHGTAATAAVTVGVVTPATGSPSGDFSILPANDTANFAPASNTGTLSAGTPSTGSINTVLLPGGSYSVTAHYTGDGTFGPSDSPGVPITVTPENSRLQIGIVTFDINTGNVVSTNATNFAYGSPYILRMDVLDHTSNACTLNVTALGCAFDATGTITLTDNTLPLDGGSFKVNSEGHAEDQPINLTAGAHTLSASYSGDVSYNASGPVTDVLTVTKATTATSLVSSATTVTTAQPVTLTATIATQSFGVGPTGTVTFSTCGTPPCTAPLVPTAFDPNLGTFAFATAALQTTFTTTGTKSITASYAGDTNYTASGPSTAVSVAVTTTGSFTVSYNPNPVVLSSSTGASVMSAVTVTPTGGFTGTVTVVCPTGASLPPGVTCTAPAPINVTSASPVAANLTLSVTATSTTLTASVAPADRTIYAAGIPPSQGGKGWWVLSATTGWLAIILLLMPGRKRFRRALGLGLVCVLSFTLGCSNNYGGGGGGGGPVATATHLSVPAPGRIASGGTFTFTATVTGGTPTDQIQLFDSGVAIGTSVVVSGGTAMLTTPALSVGTHSISAHYLGDATYTQASQSGAINVTVTGNTSVTITTNPAATPAAPTLNVTIN
jgi:hypothetical protein